SGKGIRRERHPPAGHDAPALEPRDRKLHVEASGARPRRAGTHQRPHRRNLHYVRRPPVRFCVARLPAGRGDAGRTVQDALVEAESGSVGYGPPPPSYALLPAEASGVWRRDGAGAVDSTGISLPLFPSFVEFVAACHFDRSATKALWHHSISGAEWRNPED